MGKSKLRKSFEYLGASTDLSTFSNRKKIQKLTYLLQEIYSVKLGYSFNWYLHGPYSPQLTKMLYDGDLDSESQTYELTEAERNRIDELKEFLGSDIKSSDTLELIASIHYVIAVGIETGKNDDEMIRLFRTLKPFFAEELVQYYFKRVKALVEIRRIPPAKG